MIYSPTYNTKIGQDLLPLLERNGVARPGSTIVIFEFNKLDSYATIVSRRPLDEYNPTLHDLEIMFKRLLHNERNGASWITYEHDTGLYLTYERPEDVLKQQFDSVRQSGIADMRWLRDIKKYRLAPV